MSTFRKLPLNDSYYLWARSRLLDNQKDNMRQVRYTSATFALALAALAVLGLSGCDRVETPEVITYAHHGSLAAGDTVNSTDGSLQDDYTIRVEQGWVITATLISAAFDPYVWILSPNQGSAQQLASQPGTHVVTLAHTAETSGSFIVRANSNTSGQTGGYTLQITVGPPGTAVPAPVQTAPVVAVATGTPPPPPAPQPAAPVAPQDPLVGCWRMTTGRTFECYSQSGSYSTDREGTSFEGTWRRGEGESMLLTMSIGTFPYLLEWAGPESLTFVAQSGARESFVRIPATTLAQARQSTASEGYAAPSPASDPLVGCWRLLAGSANSAVECYRADGAYATTRDGSMFTGTWRRGADGTMLLTLSLGTSRYTLHWTGTDLVTFGAQNGTRETFQRVPGRAP